MDVLQLRFEPEDEWHGKLVATCSVNGYSGHGAAWFGTERIRDFCTALESFPLSADALPSLAGGFWSDRDPAELDQVHLGIDLAPHNTRGQLRVTVRMATEVWNSEEQDLLCQATMRFLTSYADVGLFAGALRDLVGGDSTQATLRISVEA